MGCKRQVAGPDEHKLEVSCWRSMGQWRTIFGLTADSKGPLFEDKSKLVKDRCWLIVPQIRVILLLKEFLRWICVSLADGVEKTPGLFLLSNGLLPAHDLPVYLGYLDFSRLFLVRQARASEAAASSTGAQFNEESSHLLSTSAPHGHWNSKPSCACKQTSAIRDWNGQNDWDLDQKKTISLFVLTCREWRRGGVCPAHKRWPGPSQTGSFGCETRRLLYCLEPAHLELWHQKAGGVCQRRPRPHIDSVHFIKHAAANHWSGLRPTVLTQNLSGGNVS